MTEPTRTRPADLDRGPYLDGRPSEPDPLGPLRPIARRWWLVVLCAIAGVVVGVLVAEQSKPVYSATSEVNVGRVDVRVQALPGYTAGAQSLASSYSRIIGSNTILDPVARSLGITRGDAASRVSATPVPSSPIFRITGQGASPQDAIRVANTATNEIQRYVSSTNTAQNTVKSLLSRYSRQTAKADALQRRLRRMQTRRSLQVAPVPSAADVAKVRVQQSAAKLQAASLATQYQSRADELSSTAGIQVLSRPFGASSDQSSTRQRGIAAGLVGGIAVGALLAVFTDALSRRRRSRRRPA